MAVVEAEGLVKDFGKTKALCGLDLEVERGTVLGLLGPNGAGKTTAVRILTTLLVPDAGRATIDGIDVAAEPHRVRSRIGLTGQYAAVDERLTARENLEMIGRFFHLPGRRPQERADELLTSFDLSDAADRVVKEFSGGMRRRIDIAMSLVARPKVLFLDEPTTGLDPRSRLAMWDVIDQLREEGTTTLLTTQYLDEADRLTDNIVVVDHGSAIARGTSEELKAKMGGGTVTVTLSDGARPDEVAQAIAEHTAPDVTPSSEGREVRINVKPGTTNPDIVRALDAAGLQVDDVAVERPTLDDVFMSLTGRTADQDEFEEVGTS